MKRKILIAMLMAPFCCLAVWVIILSLSRASGKTVIVRIADYDAFHLFLEEHCLVYTIDWDATDCRQFPGSVCPHDDFCHGQRCRFYVDERKADSLRQLLVTHKNDQTLTLEVAYSYLPGREAIATGLLVDGVDWEEYLQSEEGATRLN